MEEAPTKSDDDEYEKKKGEEEEEEECAMEWRTEEEGR